jgi:hypothetical protein
MKRILVALSMAATFVLAGTNLGYAQEDHIAQAREHASAAVEHGKMGHADVATEHAQQAIESLDASKGALGG